MDIRDLSERAIKCWGYDVQCVVAMEELAELIQAVSKFYRGENNIENLKEEIADVYIVLDQLRYMTFTDDEKLYDLINTKIQRTLGAIYKHENK